MTKVMEIVLSTSTPESAAMVMSCSVARIARPNGVAWIIQVNPAISAMVTRMMRICSTLIVTLKSADDDSVSAPVSSGGSTLARAPCASWT